MADVILKEKAYQHLKKLILTEELAPGEQLIEKRLVELLEMSRTPIRQALERLEVEGFVNYTPNKGLTVIEPSIQRVVDFFDFRKIIESHIVKNLATRELTEEQIKKLKDNIEEQKKSIDQNNLLRFTTFDSEFHNQLAVIYGNMEIVQTMENLHDKLFLIAQKVLRKDPGRAAGTYKDHLRILECILTGRGKEAEKIVNQHMESGKRILIL